LGKTIYGWSDRPARIVGIMELMQGHGRRIKKRSDGAVPAISRRAGCIYLVRTEPGGAMHDEDCRR